MNSLAKSFFTSIALFTCCSLLGACNPALMSGFVEGMAEVQASRNREAASVGMSSSELRSFRNESASALEEGKACEQMVKDNFNRIYPEYKWATKNSDDYSAADFSNQQMMSGDHEYQALIGLISDQEICVQRFFNRLEGYGGVAAEVLGLMEILKTDLLIIYSEYLDGSITVGQMARKEVEAQKKALQAANQLASQIQSRRNTLEQQAALNELRVENRKLISRLERQQYSYVRSYRPVFCHKYYGINTVSCY